MSQIRWAQISPDDFELATLYLVEALGFDEPKRLSGSGDLGIDIVAFQPPTIPGIRKVSRKWIFQCKHAKALKKSEITEELANFASQKIDTWMLVTTCNPSPAFKRWFDGLGKSQKYSFHIHAWWCDDVEDLIRRNASSLKKSLPASLSDALNLHANVEEGNVSYEAVIAKLRLLADSQIERFARGKYIPKLYVPRKLQDEIAKFLATDADLATFAKSSISNTIDSAISQLAAYPERFNERSITLESEIASLRKRSLKLKDKGDIEALLREKQAELALRLRVKDMGKPLISDFTRRLKTLLTNVGRLPETSYLSHVDIFEAYFKEFHTVLAYLRTKTRRSRPSQSQPKPVEMAVEPVPLRASVASKNPEIYMLSDENFIFNWIDRLETGLLSVESYLKSTLVIIDRAGGGKTNLICHLVQALSAKQPVILLFGKEHFDESNGLVKALDDILNQLFSTRADESVRQLNQLLQQEAQYLTVFIDGINENRHLAELDTSIALFLNWARSHRIRIVLTCRDIYWGFFDFERWGHNVSQVFREQLNQFSSSEYEFALPLYLEHYNIDCRLADVAKEACHHPLLLRFFCEAYGSIEGETVSLGEVRDIRLKELFDIYILRKTEQIRRGMGHRNSDLVFRYLSNLVWFLFTNLTTVISSAELEEITGEADTSTQDSLYLHLLDEDIIIEEQPGEEIQTRRVTFVYEEFMEYLLALSIVKFPKKFGVKSVEDLFGMLRDSLEKWVNARGVAEYVALMLLGNGHKYSRKDAIKFLHLLARNGKIWCDAFWSVIGKCSESYLGTDLFDEFYFAIDALPDRKTIEKTLRAMSRYDVASSNKLAAIILWSSSLPRVIGWSELTQLPIYTDSEMTKLVERLRYQLQSQQFSRHPGALSYHSLVESVIGYLDSDIRKSLENAIKRYGRSPANMNVREFLYFFWKYSPEHSAFLLNGLFSDDDRVRTLCADRLRFVKQSRQQVGDLCKSLSEVEANAGIRRLLKDSAYLLQEQVRKEDAYKSLRQRTRGDRPAN